MAEIAKSIFVEVHPRLAVDLDTAKVCMKLVNWFLEANDGYKLTLENDGDGVKWALTELHR